MRFFLIFAVFLLYFPIPVPVTVPIALFQNGVPAKVQSELKLKFRLVIF